MTDRDTLREKLDIFMEDYFSNYEAVSRQCAKKRILKLIDAHDNALKEQLMAGTSTLPVHGHTDSPFPQKYIQAVPVTHIIEVFNKGGER